MKILFLTRRFYPQIGGVEKHCLEVGRELIKRGHQVTVVTEGREGSGEVEGIEGIKVFKIKITRGEKLKKFQIWAWLWNHRQIIRQNDIVQCHDVFFWYLPFRFRYPWKKVYTTFHGWEGKYPIPLKTKLVRKLSEKLSFGNICVGAFIEKWYGTKPDLVTYGGVGQSLIANPSARKGIVYIGRLEEDTGLPIYLEALKKLPEKYKNLKITFLGDGSLRKEAEKTGEVKGFIKNIQLEISQTLFVFTSGYLSILEAMINQKLVFAVYNQPLKEDYLRLSPMSQWMVMAKDPVDLAQKVEYYLGNLSESQKIIKKAFAWAKDQTWKKLTDTYLELWQKK